MGYLRGTWNILWEAVAIALAAESRRCMAAELEVARPANAMWSGCLMHSKCAGIFPCSIPDFYCMESGCAIINQPRVYPASPQNPWVNPYI